MDKTLAQKMFLKEGKLLAIINLPDIFCLNFDEIKFDKIISDAKYDAFLIFAENASQIEKYSLEIQHNLSKDPLLWVAYPKKSSKIKTDLSRDCGWKTLTEAGFITVSLISINETWSAMRFRRLEYVKNLTRGEKSDL